MEENGQHHDVSRALGHARNINRFSRLGGDVLALDTSANGLQVFGHNDNSWDQGQVFILPNQTWLSPLGYAQQMLAQSSNATRVLATPNEAAWNASLDVAALRSDDGATTVVRVVNLEAVT